MKIMTMNAALALALAGCGTSIPDSGVGFDNYAQYQARRDAQLTGQTAGTLPAPAPVDGGTIEGSDGDDIVAQTRAALGTDPAGRPVASAGPVNPPPAITNDAGISEENSFDAVSGARTIEDDAARVAASRSQYQVAQVRALPGRTGGTGPNIVSYALSTDHVPGTQLYKRRGLNLAKKNANNCAAYSGPDLAQIDFLERGGPEKDRLALDPDGDGFACGWDPRPFRRAARS